MTRVILTVFALSLLAIALDLTGLWKGAIGFGIGLFALTLILALLTIMNDSDERMR